MYIITSGDSRLLPRLQAWQLVSLNVTGLRPNIQLMSLYAAALPRDQNHVDSHSTTRSWMAARGHHMSYVRKKWQLSCTASYYTQPRRSLSQVLTQQFVSLHSLKNINLIRFPQNDNLLLPKSFAHYGKMTASFCAIKMWNSLPHPIRTLPSFTALKKNI